ncbi:MAG: AmmeMemoRadiSam system radical SAM enzyme [Candidatus Diapherotrites archaeon]|nr:AmmeMemoRadiSam system radical SAM enzyme [Candidatus Diapherotrites archaeon]
MKQALLWKPLENKTVQCNLCNRHCIIPDGKRGLCRVRENRDGVLYAMTYAKPCSIAIDPIEKKPLFHFLPGTSSLSVATVGCNFFCKHCFVPETFVITKDGAHTIEELFKKEDIHVLTKSNELHRVTKRFKHPYSGKILKIKAAFLPEVLCTPDHTFFATTEPKDGISEVEARDLTKQHFLVVPRKRPTSTMPIIDARTILSKFETRSFQVKRKRLTSQILEKMINLKEEGKTSREIASCLGFHPTYIRKIFSILKHHGKERLLTRTFETSLVFGERIRFKNEKGVGIPKEVKLDKDLAYLFGMYCAEGSVSRHPSRPNSLLLCFSFGKHEKKLVDKTSLLIEKVFGIKPKIGITKTTLQVRVSSSSLAAFFGVLCGMKSQNKKVPEPLFCSPKRVIGAFLKGYFDGDGCYKKKYVDAVSVSKKLIMGICELLIMQGVLPGFYEHIPRKERQICGRKVHVKPEYIVRFSSDFDFEKGIWRRRRHKKYHYKETDKYFFVPIRKMSEQHFEGYVYNLEVENDPTYTANFVAVHNCQNWGISQASPEDFLTEEVLPKELVSIAKKNNCKSIAYTYTEPTIFFEYAFDTSNLAHESNIKNVYVTNGYMTEDMLDMYKSLDAANVDIKGDERFYKEVCGNVEMEKILENIKYMRKKDIHVEITNLIIPGYNDDKDSITRIAQFCKDTDPDMPLHFTAFYPAYKMLNVPPTKREVLVKAREMALDIGVRYVYCGNTYPGDPYENTYCPNCGHLLIKRHGFSVLSIDMNGDRCPSCGMKIPIVLE